MAAPVESVTVPVSVAVSWAKATPQKSTTNSAKPNLIRSDLMPRFPFRYEPFALRFLRYLLCVTIFHLKCEYITEHISLAVVNLFIYRAMGQFGLSRRSQR